MKGLMVTLLVVLGSGSSFAQQFGGDDFSADRADRSGNQNSSLRTNQTRLQPLNRSFDRTSMRVAQSSPTDDSGFSPTSRQTLGGTDYKDGTSKVVPVTTSNRDSNNRLYDEPQTSVVDRQDNSRPDFDQNSRSATSQVQLRAWPLPVSPEWARTLKQEGYIYAPIQPEERNSIGEVVMFQDGSQFGNRSINGSNVTQRQWEVYRNTAIIDVDDLSLQDIQNGTLTLRNLGVENLTGVALRYVGEDGNKIDVRRIGNIPGNSSSIQVEPRDDFGRNQTAVNRGTRPNERQFRSLDQRNDSFDDRDRRPYDRRDDFDSFNRDTVNNSGWDLNDDQRIRQPFQRDAGDRFAIDRRDRFGQDDRDFSRISDRRFRNDYLDNFQRSANDQRDQRDVDYVRDRINQNRGDEYLRRNDSRFDRYTDARRIDDGSSRITRDVRDGRYSGTDGRSSDYDLNFAAQQRELQQRLLDAKRLEVKNAEDAAWLQRQRESMEEARLARFYDDDLTPLRRRSTAGYDYLGRPYTFGEDRLADRSTDPIYRGNRTDALSPVRASNASADRVAQILAEKEADLDAKIGAIDHLMKLDSASRTLDSKIDKLKNNNQSQDGARGRVQSLVSQTVPYTLGGDLAAPRGIRLASSGTSGTSYEGLNGRSLAMDINNYSQRGRSGTTFNDRSATSGTSDGRMLRLMWLLLLISLGVNFYLALLSRSFYTQYEELADELRETFSTTSSI